jgi:hypothetical protein
MKPAYQLKLDTDFISNVQRATLSTEDFGIEPTHGLFASSEWWEQIGAGKLPVVTLHGVITRRYMGSMGDWPEIEVRSDNGEVSHWTRKVNSKEQDALYVPGQRIEIDYVVQRHRPKSFDHGSEVREVIEIRVEPSTGANSAQNYARLRAQELAAAVCLNYMVIVGVAQQLGELAAVPGVMEEEARQVFTNLASEIRGATTHGKRDALTAVLEHWRQPVIEACKRLSHSKS